MNRQEKRTALKYMKNGKMLSDMRKIATKAEKIKKVANEKKVDDLFTWYNQSISLMSRSLFDTTENFRKELEYLVEKELDYE